jgi:diguanylate cyclase (GGDEF)-like protein
VNHPTALPPAAASLGVSFDGRAYHYRDYSYDQLTDALDYARLDHAKPSSHDEPTARHWHECCAPTAGERLQMAAHGIEYANGFYYYGPYRYDLLVAALEYARRAPGLALDSRACAALPTSMQDTLLGLPQLQVLLTLARELFQTDDADAVVALLGRAVVEMTEASSGLLLLRHGQWFDTIGFDNRGVASPSGAGHRLYGVATDLMAERRTAEQDAGSAEQREARDVLAVAVPQQGTLSVLAFAWDHNVAPAMASRFKAALSCSLELAGAALGSIGARRSLEQLVGDQREEMSNSDEAHAAELARRDRDEREMRVLSLTDVATGLYNRRGFFLQAEQIFKVAQRRRTRSAVIFADIDGLKEVNDQLGHDAGDHLIWDTGKLFRQSFREADVVARLGGDEFVAYTLDDAHPDVILQRIRDKLHAFNLTQRRPYRISLSAGAVQCESAAGHPLAAYVRMADELMYDHKRRRRQAVYSA